MIPIPYFNTFIGVLNPAPHESAGMTWIHRAAPICGLLFFLLCYFGSAIMLPVFAVTTPSYHQPPKNSDPAIYEGYPAAFESVAPALPAHTKPFIQLAEVTGTARFHFNAELFSDLRLLVYGSPSLVQHNDFKPVEGGYYRLNGFPGEYRYHGYSAEGNLFTNQRFPNDASSEKALSAKKWVHLPWQAFTGIVASGFNQLALAGDPGMQAWFDRALPFPILDNTCSSAAKRGGSYLPEEHLLVLSGPSAGMPGEGRMWHMVENRRWYQTFSLPDLAAGREQMPLLLKVEILDKGTHVLGPQASVPVRVRLTATLQDGAVFSNNVQRSLRMTRNEIREWTLSESKQQPRGLMAPLAFSTYHRMDQNNHAVLSAEITLLVKKADLNQSGMFSFEAQTAITYQENQASPVITASDSCQIGVDMTPQGGLKSSFSVADIHYPTRDAMHSSTVQYVNQSQGPITRYAWTLSAQGTGMTETFEMMSNQISSAAVSERLGAYVNAVMPEGVIHRNIHVVQTVFDAQNQSHSSEKSFNAVVGGESKAVELNAALPDWAFDMVPYGAQDLTNHAETAAFSVTVDGSPVQASHFFSGQFKFSEVVGLLGHGNRPVKVVLEAITQEGVVSFSERWIEVVSTQPKTHLKFNGTQKVNRKLEITNTSSEVEDPRLSAAYPAAYTFTYKAVSGSDASRRMVEISPLEKHLLYKSPGRYQVVLTAVNALGRTGEPAVLDLVIHEDRIPAAIFNLSKGVLVRGEKQQIFLDLASTDGDILGEPVIKVFYDPGIDGIYERSMGLYTPDNIHEFIPLELGAYRYTLEIDETFGQPTLSNFITPADTKKLIVFRDFLCDNLRPVQTVDLEAPRCPDQVDVLILLSPALPEEVRTDVGANRIHQANQLRLAGMDALVHVWDLGEITNRVPASTTQIFGTTYPPETLDYAAGGYSGQLLRVSVQDNGRYVDYGTYRTVESCHTEQVLVDRYCPEANPFICYVGGGYVDVYETQVVCSTSQVWESDVRWQSNYYGTYEGEISKTVEQDFDPEWLRFGAFRYVIYMGADGEIKAEPEAEVLKEVSGAAWITCGGTPALAACPGTDQAFSGTPAEALDQALTWIANRHEVLPHVLVLLGDRIRYHTADIETEGDDLTGEVWRLTQETHFDNPLPPLSFQAVDGSGNPFTLEAGSATEENPFYTMFPPEDMTSVGLFVVQRKLKDVTPRPTFDLESNAASASFTVHRKPIAALALKARFDTLRHQYRVYWTDASYDPDHVLSDPNRGIVRSDFRIRLQGGLWRYGFPTFLDAGTYEASYVVWDLEGQISDPVHYLFTVDNSAPEIRFLAVVPDPAMTGSRPTVTLLPLDHDGDLLTLRLTVTHHDGKHTYEQIFTGVIPGKSFTLKLSEPLIEGTYTLKATVTDARGASESAARNLLVRAPRIVSAGVIGAWNHWRGQIDRQGRQLTEDPLRFLAYEALKLELRAEGEPDLVTCRLSPELEAMVYTDPNGRVYRYEEAFGQTRTFPVVLSPAGSGLWRADYKLPLAPSTLDWKDNRLRASYWIEFTVTWGEREVSHRLDKVELTGNIYDLIF